MKTSIFLFFLSLSHLLSAQTPQLYVLGTAQDGGFPHIGCQKECQLAHKNPELSRYATSLALADPQTGKWWLFEASPSMDKQLQLFQELTNNKYPYLPEGIFLTHAHIGHYAGLMFLGREALGAQQVKVHTLPKFATFLSNHGPWSQLVNLKNISCHIMQENEALPLVSSSIQITAFKVPHRDEFSETAGFRIKTDKHTFLFIPDIDKWSKWEQSIVNEVKKVDYAFIDATFYADGELPNRSASEVPHPFVSETMQLFSNESADVKTKVQFIHFNHSNPLLWDQKTRQQVINAGFGLAEQGSKYE